MIIRAHAPQSLDITIFNFVFVYICTSLYLSLIVTTWYNNDLLNPLTFLPFITYEIMTAPSPMSRENQVPQIHGNARVAGISRVPQPDPWGIDSLAKGKGNLWSLHIISLVGDGEKARRKPLLTSEKVGCRHQISNTCRTMILCPTLGLDLCSYVVCGDNLHLSI